MLPTLEGVLGAQVGTALPARNQIDFVMRSVPGGRFWYNLNSLLVQLALQFSTERDWMVPVGVCVFSSSNGVSRRVQCARSHAGAPAASHKARAYPNALRHVTQP
eukprot:1541851-Rhodomonas_salina.1